MAIKGFFSEKLFPFEVSKFCMNFLFWQYVLNVSDYMSANIQARQGNGKETGKVIIKLVILFFFNKITGLGLPLKECVHVNTT